MGKLLVALLMITSCAYTTVKRTDRHEKIITVKIEIMSTRSRLHRYLKHRAKSIYCDKILIIEVVEGSHIIGRCVYHP